ncbi:4'-phosphopantetheinyl transferase superfamily protein [Streptomyces sp. NPDC020858]|uniref:4'-phosphopantetheinyl transferase superfamily protein n=1 Tax=Streptomyces sp. NPDC020858 TaxID=3365097 RepID=UPI0037B39B31
MVLWRPDTRQDVIGGHRVGGALLDTAERSRAAALVRPGDRHRARGPAGPAGRLPGHPAGAGVVRTGGLPALRGPARQAGPGRRPSGGASLLAHAQRCRGRGRRGHGTGRAGHRGPSSAGIGRGGLLRFLHPRESAALLALSAAARPAALARVWVRKEACLKATGAGIGYGLTHPFAGASPVPAPVPGWTSSDLWAPLGYCAALAAPTPPQGLHTRSADETEGAAA